MRIALISSVKRLATGEMYAQTELGGRSVLSWQVGRALQTGCERIICLCDAPTPHIIEEQHFVEGKGLAFHTVRSPLQIAGLVRAEDDVFMQLDGLIVADDAFLKVMGKGDAFEPSIRAISHDHPLASHHPDAFERMDRDRNWAGLAIIPGACVSALEDMPEDGDTMSLLLRLGLQVRVPCETVGPDIIEDNRWFLASDAKAIEQLEDDLLEEALPPVHWMGPSAFLAKAIVSRAGTRWLASGAQIAWGAAIAVMALAAVIAGLGYGIAGLGVAVVSAFAAQLAAVLSSLQSALSSDAHKTRLSRYCDPAVLALGTLVLVLANTGAAGIAVQIALPLIAMASAELAGRSKVAQSRAFWRDTPMHLAFFCLTALLGVLTEALLVFSLGALLQMMLRSQGKSDRTS